MLLLYRRFIELLVVFLGETSSLKACIRVTWEKHAKNASTGPNKFNIQYHYTPEKPIEPTAFAVFGSGKTW